MTVQFPDWYAGGFPDAELAIKDLLNKYLAELDPAPRAVTWLPDKYGEKLPLVRVIRMPGPPLEVDGLVDASLIQVGVIADNREDSWKIAEYIRQILRAYQRGGGIRMADNSIVQVQSIESASGPALAEALNFDHRLVPAVYRVKLRIDKSLPDYSRITANV